MDFRPALFVVALLIISLVSATATAQVDYSEFMVDGQITQEQAEILQQMEGLLRHKRVFMEEYVTKRMDEEFPDPMEADPSAMRSELEKLREEADEAYGDEYPDKTEQFDAYEAQLRAIAKKERGQSESKGDTEQDLSEIFDDVDAEVAVYSRQDQKVTGNDGHMILQDDGQVVEFCYADSGCEDRSEIEGRMTGGIGEMIVHRSDPDKEVVGLRLHLMVHPDSASKVSFFVATGHTSDAFGNPFEMEELLFESSTYGPGNTITYDLGETD